LGKREAATTKIIKIVAMTKIQYTEAQARVRGVTLASRDSRRLPEVAGLFRFTTRYCREEEAQVLEAPLGCALLLIRETTYDTQDIAIEYSVSQLRGDRYIAAVVSVRRS
jgi:DNA-binding GntR family transcriptional regulator